MNANAAALALLKKGFEHMTDEEESQLFDLLEELQIQTINLDDMLAEEVEVIETTETTRRFYDPQMVAVQKGSHPLGTAYRIIETGNRPLCWIHETLQSEAKRTFTLLS